MFRRLWFFVTRGRRIEDLDDEMRLHLELRAAAYRERGLSPEEARREARRRFGNQLRLREEGRDMWGFPGLERGADNVRHAFRRLVRQPGLSAAVVTSLALGIGANIAIFSIFSSLLLRPLPVPSPDRLVQVTPGGDFGDAWTYPLWDQFRDRQTALAGVCAWSARGAKFDLSTAGVPEIVNGLWVSASFFDVLGVTPAVGRTFVAVDDTRGGGAAGPVAVISYAFWQRRFLGSADVVGRAIAVNGIPFTIVGVTPARFRGPDLGIAFDVAVPFGTLPRVLRRDRLGERYSWWLTVMGRLKPGQTASGAAAELAPLQSVLRDLTKPAADVLPEVAARYLDTPMLVTPAPGGPSALRDHYRPALSTLMAIVGLILLIACANVANLLLAQAERRRRDVSVQLALGASRSSVVFQSLIESLLLTAFGTLISIVTAPWIARWLVTQMPVMGWAIEPSATLDVSLDWRVLGFASVLSVAVALLFGIIPAMYATRIHPIQAMSERRPTTGLGRGRFGQLLIVCQVAFSLVLIVGSVLFVRTFASLHDRFSGVDRDRVLIVAARFTSESQFLRIMDAVRAVPGVADVAFSSNTPLSGAEDDTLIENPPGLSLPEADRRVYRNSVSASWFSIYGIPLVAGREFTARDERTTSTDVIVNEAFARRFFEGRNAVGQMIAEVGRIGEQPPRLTIVGVVKDSVYGSLREPPTPTLYAQAASFAWSTISVRTIRPPAQLSSAMRAAIADVDGRLPVTVRTLAGDVALSTARERLLAVLAAFLGGLGLFMSALGLYGVVSYGVAARRIELGIRVALGASRFSILWLVGRRIALLLTIGVLVGVPVSLLSARSAAALLFGVGPQDPATYCFALATLVVVGMFAAIIPARRAIAISPASSLRGD